METNNIGKDKKNMALKDKEEIKTIDMEND